MFKFKKTIYFIVCLLGWPLVVLADAMTYQADRLEGGVVNDKPCKQLEGNVVFTFHTSGMVLTADKA